LRLILILLIVPLSCSQKIEVPEIVLPSTPIMKGTTSWGVVNVSYLKINKEPNNDQHIVTTLRKGDLVQIESVHYINEGRNSSIWFHISKDRLNGWVKDSSLDSYSTKEKAKTASERLLGTLP
jgi:predicted SnoaL-like aldol condensation-catalyzing enzyme